MRVITVVMIVNEPTCLLGILVNLGGVGLCMMVGLGGLTINTIRLCIIPCYALLGFRSIWCHFLEVSECDIYVPWLRSKACHYSMKDDYS